jgi:hypothetical protein
LNLIVAFPSFTKRVNTCSIFFFTYKYKKQTKWYVLKCYIWWPVWFPLKSTLFSLNML